MTVSTDLNGVRVQVWSALCAYLLVAIATRENALTESLHQVLQVTLIAAPEKVPLPELFAKLDTTNDPFDTGIQLKIRGFWSDGRRPAPFAVPVLASEYGDNRSHSSE